MGSNGFYNYPNGTAFMPTVYVPAEQTPIVLAGTLVVQDLQAVGINAQLRPIAGASMGTVYYQGDNMYFEEQNFGYPNSELLTDQSFYSYFFSAGPADNQTSFAQPDVENEYLGSVAALENSTSAQQFVADEQNIQGIIANYLPSIPLFYPNFIWAYNSQRVANWPQSPSSFEIPGLVYNLTALANLQPANLVTGTTATTSASTTSSQTVTTQSSATTSSTSTGSSLYIAVAVIIVVVVVIGAVLAVRRRPPKR
jgi:ABC-type transport system substrate-binding protein